MAEPQTITLPALIENLRAEAKERSPEGLQVDLGCGERPYDGLMGIDFYAPNADLNLDLFSADWGLDLFEEKSNLISFAYSSHFVEHLPNFAAFFTGLYDAMEDEAVAVLVTPYWSSVRAFQDPTHKQAISEARYQYLSRKWREANGLNHYLDLDEVDFEALGFIHHMHPDFAHLGEAQKAYHIAHTLNAVNDIVAVLRCRKDSDS